MEVPELERRKEHLDLISPTYPLLEVALDCLKDKEGQRPTAEQLCSRLIALKESAAYRDSLQHTPEDTNQELQQQLRESESRVEDLTSEVQQLTLQNEEKTRSIQQKDEQVQQKDRQLEQQDQQLQASKQENEEVAAALQQSVEQKDAVIRAKDELLQEKERDTRTAAESEGEGGKWCGHRTSETGVE